MRPASKTRISVSVEITLLEKPGRLSGVSDTTALVGSALKVLIERESAHALARLGGSALAAPSCPNLRLALSTADVALCVNIGSRLSYVPCGDIYRRLRRGAFRPIRKSSSR